MTGADAIAATVSRMTEHGDDAGIMLRLGDVRALVAAHEALRVQSDERLSIVQQLSADLVATRAECLRLGNAAADAKWSLDV